MSNAQGREYMYNDERTKDCLEPVDHALKMEIEEIFVLKILKINLIFNNVFWQLGFKNH